MNENEPIYELNLHSLLSILRILISPDESLYI